MEGGTLRGAAYAKERPHEMTQRMQTGSSELVKKQEVNCRQEWLTLCTWDLGTLSRRLWESAEGFKQGQQLYARKHYSNRD